jgi:hypothetical protein
VGLAACKRVRGVNVECCLVRIVVSVTVSAVVGVTVSAVVSVTVSAVVSVSYIYCCI